MIVLRSLAFNLYFFAGTALALLLAGVPCLVLPRGFAHAAARTWAAATLWGLRAIVGLRYQLRGDAGALHRPCVLAVKHQSAWDTIVFLSIARDSAYVLKKELLAIPVYGWLVGKLELIPVDRNAGGSAMRAMLRQARRAFGDGRQIVIFPQGTRVAPGEHAPYQPGVAALYAFLNAPVVPVALNSGLFWARRSFLKRPGTIVVEFLPEIGPGLAREEFMRELETRIETASARLAVETARQQPNQS
jgi:1-acyl-sn-glycerol-3-phosphate acyltransferase